MLFRITLPKLCRQASLLLSLLMHINSLKLSDLPVAHATYVVGAISISDTRGAWSLVTLTL